MQCRIVKFLRCDSFIILPYVVTYYTHSHRINHFSKEIVWRYRLFRTISTTSESNRDLFNRAMSLKQNWPTFKTTFSYDSAFLLYAPKCMLTLLKHKWILNFISFNNKVNSPLRKHWKFRKMNQCFKFITLIYFFGHQDFASILEIRIARKLFGLKKIFVKFTFYR